MLANGAVVAPAAATATGASEHAELVVQGRRLFPPTGKRRHRRLRVRTNPRGRAVVATAAATASGASEHAELVSSR